jgi:hypothetical protein
MHLLYRVRKPELQHGVVVLDVLGGPHGRGRDLFPHRVSLYQQHGNRQYDAEQRRRQRRGWRHSRVPRRAAQSTVSGNTASASSAAEGGSIYANIFYASRSTISKRRQACGRHPAGATSFQQHGLQQPDAADQNGRGHLPTTGEVFNSTIAGNTSGGNVAAGLYGASAAGGHDRALAIIASKPAESTSTSGPPPGKSFPGSNLINAHQAQTFLPANDFRRSQARPLRDNGGPTQTLELLPDGSRSTAGNAFGIQFDQRGVPRVGITADIGAPSPTLSSATRSTLSSALQRRCIRDIVS